MKATTQRKKLRCITSLSVKLSGKILELLHAGIDL